MTITTNERNRMITELLNETIFSFQNIVPITFEISRPQLRTNPVNIQFGVLIGMTGDIRGHLVLSGKSSLFQTIGEKMFGMVLDGPMLSSFTGELGNMLAGKLFTVISEKGSLVNITPPTIIEGDTSLSGFNRAIQLDFNNPTEGTIHLYFLLEM